MNNATIELAPLPMEQAIWTDPERLSGTPCFAGTRVPVQSLFDYLEAGDTLSSFLEDFPGVTREQAISILNHPTFRVPSS